MKRSRLVTKLIRPAGGWRGIFYPKYALWFYPEMSQEGLGVGEPSRLPLGVPVEVIGGVRRNKPLVTTIYGGRRWFAYVPSEELRRKSPIHSRSR